jgi:SH3-like domain-containing protein
VAVILPAAMLAACTTTDSGASAAANGQPARYVVVAESTAFYKYGPAQASGPDMQLFKGQPVTMLERHYGYSRVETVDGQAGYVPTDDLNPAPNAPQTAAVQPKKSGGSGSGGSRGSSRTPDFAQPNDSALPSSQPPSDAPAPSFRY